MRLIVFLILIAIPLFSYAEMIIDNNIFSFDRKVDNAYLSCYTFGGSSEYFDSFFAIDTAYYAEGGYHYGIGSDRLKGGAYYFDEHKKVRHFGVNTDTGESVFMLIDRVAATSLGKIYIIDQFADILYYWNIKGKTFEPEGNVKKGFFNLRDIYCDMDSEKENIDNKYINFTAEKDIVVIVIQEKNEGKSGSYNYTKNYCNSYVFKSIDFGCHMAGTDITYFTVQKGETFNMDGTDSHSFAPVVFIIRK